MHVGFKSGICEPIFLKSPLCVHGWLCVWVCACMCMCARAITYFHSAFKVHGVFKYAKSAGGSPVRHSNTLLCVYNCVWFFEITFVWDVYVHLYCKCVCTPPSK